MEAQADSRIIGKPTLLVTYTGKLDPQVILSAIGAIGYSLGDVSVYYRVTGTDQVLDASTGQVAAGQALCADELRGKSLDRVDTLVLLHPDGAQFVALQGALKPLGNADFKYSEQTIAGGDTNDQDAVKPSDNAQAG